MPCTQRKARILLKQKKAKIIGYKPFAIQLLYPTGEATQPVSIGVDEGAVFIGIAVTSGEKVLAKGEIELRHKTKVQKSISDLLTARATLRRSRRNRKTRHRKARFLNRRKPEGWLPPSLQARVDATFFWIDKFSSLLPEPKLHIEVGKFDAAKMINPEIKGVDYQHGQCYGYYDVRYFVFARDEYTCQVCGKKDKILQTHHIVYRKHGGTDRADNLITVCTDCHTSKNHAPGGVLHKWDIEHKKVKQYKEPPFMNALRRRTFQKYPDARITYGSETTERRKKLELEKTHYNDAIAISGVDVIKENPRELFYLKQFRKKKRSLHEAIPRKGRKEPNRTQKRNAKNTKAVKGWYKNDCVRFEGQIGWIHSFSGASVYVRNTKEETIGGKAVPLSRLKLLCHNNNWEYEVRQCQHPAPVGGRGASHFVTPLSLSAPRACGRKQLGSI